MNLDQGLAAGAFGAVSPVGGLVSRGSPVSVTADSACGSRTSNFDPERSPLAGVGKSFSLTNRVMIFCPVPWDRPQRC